MSDDKGTKHLKMFQNSLLPLDLNILADLANERRRQDEKWGEQNHNDEIWLVILSEELGEVAQALLHNKYGGTHAGTLRDELIQVTAVAIQWLDCIDRNGEVITRQSVEEPEG